MLVPQRRRGEDGERHPDDDEGGELQGRHRLAEDENGGKEDERGRDVLQEARRRIADAADRCGEKHEGYRRHHPATDQHGGVEHRCAEKGFTAR